MIAPISSSKDPMKRLIPLLVFAAVALVGALLLSGSPSEAQSDPVVGLLVFPAPPPVGTVIEPAAVERSEEFYSKAKVPDDEAPIEELLDYWTHHGVRNWESGYFPKPSPRSLERLKDAVDADPKLLPSLLRILPAGKESSSWVKDLYDEDRSSDIQGREWRSQVRMWLEYNSPYFTHNLERRANQVAEADGYVSGHQALIQLAKLDWDKARPIVERLEFSSSPVLRTVAKWARYARAVAETSGTEAESVRAELKAIVENRNASDAERDLAMDALVKEPEWPGRDEWYFSLFEDESLLDLRVGSQSLTGLTTIITESDPLRFRDKLIALLKGGDPVRRSAAAQALSRLAEEDADAIEPLLPWLEDRNWTKDGNGARLAFVKALAKHKVPDSVPGLISMLDGGEWKEPTVLSPADGSGNSSITVSNSATATNAVGAQPTRKSFEFREAAAEALSKQADPRAAPTLRRILFSEPANVRIFSNALYFSGGFTPAEVAEAVELRASASLNSEESDDGTAVPRRTAILGEVGLVLDAEKRISDGAAAAIALRIRQIERKNLPVATAMRRMLASWNGAGVNLANLGDLADGKADTLQIVSVLASRKYIRERQSDELSGARQRGDSYAKGIIACIEESSAAFSQMLSEGDEKSKAAFYACARLLRIGLPVDSPARDIASANGVLSLAAEKYLESMDTAESRRLVWAKHPGEKKILGATYTFENADSDLSHFSNLAKSVDPALDGYENYYAIPVTSETVIQEKMRAPLNRERDLETVYSYRNNLVKLYKDRTVLNWTDGTDARFRERILRAEELANLLALLDAQNAEDHKPTISFSSDFPKQVELIRMNREGGRRVFAAAKTLPPLFAELDSYFAGATSEGGRLRYAFEDTVGGAEVLYDGGARQAETIWKQGSDFRVLVSDVIRKKSMERQLDLVEEAEEVKPDFDTENGYTEQWKRRERYLLQSFSWHTLGNGGLIAPAEQPSAARFLPTDGGLPPNDRWKSKAATVQVRADDTALVKIVNGVETVLRKGGYSNPVVTPDGKWVFAKRSHSEGSDSYGDVVVRINLATKAERVVDFAEDKDRREPVAYLESLGKVLILAGFYEDHHHGEGDETPEYIDDLSLAGSDVDFYLLDPLTLSVTPARGNYLPFMHQTFRPLQPTGRPNEFWAAIPKIDWENGENRWSEVGLINSRTGAFRPLVSLPKVFFGSMAMWVDDKLYFVYHGHVVAIPKPNLPAAR